MITGMERVERRRVSADGGESRNSLRIQQFNQGGPELYAWTYRRGSSMTDKLKPETDDVRQGETGHGVRYMLGASIVLVVVAFAVMAIFAMQPTGG
jgi:hypothetical protein